MKCPHCGSENRDSIKFCEDCGVKLEIECPSCRAKILIGKKFCGECGSVLGSICEPLPEPKKSTPHIPFHPTDPYNEDVLPAEVERKYVTVLFSDMSGYTAMPDYQYIQYKR